MSLFYRGAPYAPENHAVSGVETGLSARFLGRFYPFMKTTYEYKKPLATRRYQFPGGAYRH